MEADDKALLRIVTEHLRVTERLLAHYMKLARAVRVQPEIAVNLPEFEEALKLQELHATTRKLQLVDAIV